MRTRIIITASLEKGLNPFVLVLSEEKSLGKAFIEPSNNAKVVSTSKMNPPKYCKAQTSPLLPE